MCTPTKIPTDKYSRIILIKWILGALYLTAIIIAGFYFIPERCDCRGDNSNYDDSTKLEYEQLKSRVEFLENEIEIKDQIIASQQELLNVRDEIIKHQ